MSQPDAIGNFRILRQLGSGGMGTVYEAINEAIERRVAIKVLRPEYACNQEFVTRFFNEARAVNRIEHPSLVQISEYGQTADGTVYIVMEYLRGETLTARLQRFHSRGERQPLVQTLQTAWQLAEALAAAHDKGIVHRDLKPDNVILVPDPVAPCGERAKLLDFGIAKLVQSNMDHTGTMVIMGTPSYMSPEQCRGAGAVTDRTDVYSLGTMLYQMVAGRLPFVGEGSGDLIGQHLHVEPPPLSSLAPSAPALLTALVHRLLIKDKEQRPPMREALTELRRLIDAGTGQLALAGQAAAPQGSGAVSAASASMETVSTLGRSQGERPRRPHSEGRRLFSAVALGSLLVVGVVGVGMTWRRWSPERAAAPQRDRLPDAVERSPAQQTMARPAAGTAPVIQPVRQAAPLAPSLTPSPVVNAAPAAEIPSLPARNPLQRAEPSDQEVRAAIGRLPQSQGVSQLAPRSSAPGKLRADAAAPAHEPVTGSRKPVAAASPKRASVAMVGKQSQREAAKEAFKPQPSAKLKAGLPVEYED